MSHHPALREEGGTLGVFPIWENYAILQTQKYYLSHRKSHGRWWDRVLLKRKIFANLFRNPCGRMDFFQMFLLDFTPSPRLFFLINGCQGRWAEAEFMHGRICRFLFPIWFVFVFFWFANMYFHTFQIKYLRAYLHLWICISSADLSPIAISAVAKIDRSQVLDSILILISPFDDDDWWWW